MKKSRTKSIGLVSLIASAVIAVFLPMSALAVEIRPLADIQRQYANIDNLSYEQILNNADRTGALYDIQAQIEARREKNTREEIREIPALLDLQENVVEQALIKYPEHRAALERAREVLRQRRDSDYTDENLALANDMANACARLDIPCHFRTIISYTGEIFKQIFGLILAFVGLAFNLSIKISITDFATYANSDAVRIAWSTLRDVTNLFFIFILLYVAISTILQLPGINGRQMLVSVITIALLINFSAFFAKLVIDASNVVAYQFYSAISSGTAKFAGAVEVGGISGTFMSALPMASAIAQGGGTFINALTISFGNVAMMVVAIFVFGTATILFATRTVTLVFLIILSPLAFLMYAIPGRRGLYDKWWNTLFDQAFFAPLFLLMMYVVLIILKNDPLKAILETQENAGLQIVISFIINIGLMMGAIIVAKSMGGKAARATLGLARSARKRAQSYAGRGTIGRAGRQMAESKWLKNLEEKNPRIGGTLRSIGEYGAKQKFGGKQSYEDVLKQRTKAAERYKDEPEKQAEYLKNLGPGRLAQTLQRVPGLGRLIPTTSQPQQAAYEKLKPEQKLKLEEKIDEAKKEAMKVSQDEVEQELQEFLRRPENTKVQQDLLRGIKTEDTKRYEKELEKLKQRRAKAPTDPADIAKAKQKASQGYDRTKISLQRMRGKLSKSDEDKLDKAEKKKKRDDRIKELQTISSRNPQEEAELTGLKQERKDDRDEDLASRLESATQKIEESGEKSGEKGGGGEEKKE